MSRRAVGLGPLAAVVLLWAGLVGLCPGCARAPDPADRRQAALALAAGHGLAPIPVPGAVVPVLVLGRPGSGDDLVVYIEGDGLAYLDRATPSPDPTPVHPLALELAGLDPAPKLAYLGRPCQYAGPLPAACARGLWTTDRFGPVALAALDAALDAAKAALGARRLHLIGYSGGGAMAVLLAAGRRDVASLVTVAGNLDAAGFCAWHRVSPLSGSAEPLEAAPALAGLPQTHLSGARDTVCPTRLAEHFLTRQGRPPGSRLLVVPGVGHAEGWVRVWPELLDRIRSSAPDQPSSPGASDRKSYPVLPEARKRNS